MMKNHMIVVWQVGNLWLMLGLLSLSLLFTTSDPSVVRCYQAVYAFGDLGHLFFVSYGMGAARLLAISEWNLMTWTNFGRTVGLDRVLIALSESSAHSLRSHR